MYVLVYDVEALRFDGFRCLRCEDDVRVTVPITIYGFMPLLFANKLISAAYLEHFV